MGELDESFEKLLGRIPTDAERQNLYRVRDALGLGNNDALWLIIMALQHYKTLYEAIPAKIEKATTVAAKNAETEAVASVNKAAAKLVEDVSGNIRRAIVVREWRNVFIALAACFVVAAGALVGFGAYTRSAAYSSGYKAGYADAETKFADQKISANWSNTKTGQMAYEMYRKERLAEAYGLYKTGDLEEAYAMYQNGDIKWAYQLSQADSLERLAKCDIGEKGNRWQKKRRNGRMYCFPAQDTDGIVMGYALQPSP